jgi:hypothetical protein
MVPMVSDDFFAERLQRISLHRQRVLVRQNLREFERLEDLRLEDWTSSI